MYDMTHTNISKVHDPHLHMYDMTHTHMYNIHDMAHTNVSARRATTTIVK